MQLPEHRDRDDQSDRCDEMPHHFLGKPLGIGCPEIVSGNCTDGHDHHVGPVDQSVHGEPNGSDQVDQGTENVLQGVHLVDV